MVLMVSSQTTPQTIFLQQETEAKPDESEICLVLLELVLGGEEIIVSHLL